MEPGSSLGPRAATKSLPALASALRPSPDGQNRRRHRPGHVRFKDGHRATGAGTSEGYGGEGAHSARASPQRSASVEHLLQNVSARILQRRAGIAPVLAQRSTTDGPPLPTGGGLGVPKGGKRHSMGGDAWGSRSRMRSPKLEPSVEAAATKEHASLLYEGEKNRAVTVEWIRGLSHRSETSGGETNRQRSARGRHHPHTEAVPEKEFHSPILSAYVEFQRAALAGGDLGGEQRTDMRLAAAVRALLSATSVDSGVRDLVGKATTSLLECLYDEADEARDRLRSAERLASEGPPQSILTELHNARDSAAAGIREAESARRRAEAAEARAAELESQLAEARAELDTLRRRSSRPSSRSASQSSPPPPAARGTAQRQSLLAPIVPGVGLGIGMSEPSEVAPGGKPPTAESVIEFYDRQPPRARSRVDVLLALLDRDGDLLHSTEAAEAIMRSIDPHDATLVAYKQIVRRPPPLATKRALLADLVADMDVQERHDLASEVVHSLSRAGHQVIDIFEDASGPSQLRTAVMSLTQAGLLSEDTLSDFVDALPKEKRGAALRGVFERHGERTVLQAAAELIGREGKRGQSAAASMAAHLNMQGLVLLVEGVTKSGTCEGSPRVSRAAALLFSAGIASPPAGSDLAQDFVRALSVQGKMDLAEATPLKRSASMALQEVDGNIRRAAGRANSRRSLTISVAVDFANRIVAQKVTNDAADEREGKLPQGLLDFIEDYFLAKFSVRSVSRMYTRGLLRTLERLSDEHPRLRTLRLMCGLDLSEDMAHLAPKRERMLAAVVAAARGPQRLAQFLKSSAQASADPAKGHHQAEEGGEGDSQYAGAAVQAQPPSSGSRDAGMVPLPRAKDILRAIFPTSGGPLLFSACQVSKQTQERFVESLLARGSAAASPDAHSESAQRAGALPIDALVEQVASLFSDAVAEGRERLQELFVSFDADGNGLMDLNEFKEFIGQTIPDVEVTDRQVVRLFKSLGDLSDSDRKGEDPAEEDLIMPDGFARLCEMPEVLMLAR